MLGTPQDDAARTSVFAETVRALRGAQASRFEVLLVTDSNLTLVGEPPELPPYLSLVVEIASGRLTARRRENLACLCAAIDAALSAEGAQSIPFKLSTQNESIFIYGTAERAGFLTQSPLVLFNFLHPQTRTLPCAKKLSAWFGLSKTEGAVAIELAGGKDIADIAAGRSLSELTIRTHLRTIFEKTNTHSQRDLVALLVRLAGI